MSYTEYRVREWPNDREGLCCAQEWFDSANRLHRENGPAMISVYGDETWYKHGTIHRDDGPAFIAASGYKQWVKDGKLHCEIGPAVINPDGRTQYYLHGKEFSYAEWYDTLHPAKRVREMTVAEISQKLGYEVKIIKE